MQTYKSIPGLFLFKYCILNRDHNFYLKKFDFPPKLCSPNPGIRFGLPQITVLMINVMCRDNLMEEWMGLHVNKGFDPEATWNNINMMSSANTLYGTQVRKATVSNMITLTLSHVNNYSIKWGFWFLYWPSAGGKYLPRKKALLHYSHGQPVIRAN